MKHNRRIPGRQLPRRSFLKGCLTAGAFSFIAPHVSWAAEAVSANEKVNLACCGIGNRGAEVIRALHQTGHANIVAFCDTDMGAPHTEAMLKQFPDVPRFQDFREMFDKMGNRFDAVSVATPDFSHFPIAMLAMSQGKHVYCEKPMAHSFRQTELMMAAEKKYRVAAQMGNQGHSEANYFQFKAWVEAGIIKNVTRVIAFMNNPRRWHGMNVSGYLPEQPTPESLDWETWLATARFHPYNKGYMNGEWRSWYDFGNGALGDWGAHIIDTAHEFLQLGLPTEVSLVQTEGHSEFIFPQASTISFKFAKRGSMPPVEIVWYDGQKNLPPLPAEFGEAVVDANIPPPSSGQLDTRRYPPGKLIYGEDLMFKGGSHGSTLKIIPEAKARDMASKLPTVPRSSSNHFLNFLRAAKGQEKCRSSFEVAGPLSQVLDLGVLAQRFNAKLEFDPVKKQITNHKLANEALAGAPPRKDWEQFYKM